MVKGNYLTPEEKQVTYELSFTEGIFDLVSSMGHYVSTSTDEEVRRIALRKREEGNTIRDISVILNELGYNISKSAVGRMLKG